MTGWPDAVDMPVGVDLASRTSGNEALSLARAGDDPNTKPNVRGCKELARSGSTASHPRHVRVAQIDIHGRSSLRNSGEYHPGSKQTANIN